MAGGLCRALNGPFEGMLKVEQGYKTELMGTGDIPSAEMFLADVLTKCCVPSIAKIRVPQPLL